MTLTETLTDIAAERWSRPSLFRRVARVPHAAADLTRRGIAPADPERAAELAGIAHRFLDGYNAMLEAHPLGRLEELLADIPDIRHGFAVEGAAMGAAMRDGMSLRGGLLDAVLARHGDRFEYLMAVGTGWAIARMPWRARRIEAAFDPLLGALARDGRGFHDLYFSPRRAETGAIRRYRGGMARDYDTGLGRALWFIGSGHVPRVLELAGRFDAARRPDLFAGIGLAMAYAGPTTAQDWVRIRQGCGAHWAHVGQGICFAAEAMRRSGAIPPHTDMACRVALNLAPETAARLAADSRPHHVSRPDAVASYAGWRREIREKLDRATSQPERVS